MKVVATSRSAQGSSASRRLRRAGKVPGIIYGSPGNPTAIEVEHNPLFHALRVEAFHASILDMELDGQDVADMDDAKAVLAEVKAAELPGRRA